MKPTKSDITVKTFVLSGTYQQYRYWQQKYDRERKSVHLQENARAFGQMQGCVAGRLILYGTYYERRDSVDIIEYAKQCGFTVNEVYDER